MTRNVAEVDGVDGECEAAREVYAAWEEKGLRMVETKDLDLRRCLFTCLSCSSIMLSGFQCTPSVCDYVRESESECHHSITLPPSS